MKIPKQAYTSEFKELAVKRVKDGQSISSVVKELGLSDQTLRNWVKSVSRRQAQRRWRKGGHA
jgi:transposase